MIENQLISTEKQAGSTLIRKDVVDRLIGTAKFAEMLKTHGRCPEFV
jgi:hypothetical protein